MIQYLKAAKKADFKHKNYKCLRFMTKNIVIIKKDEGSFYAMEADCRHQNANLLSKGLPKDFVITCPRHSWRYDMKTGKSLTNDWGHLRQYPLKVEGDDILVGTKPIEEEDTEEDFFL